MSGCQGLTPVILATQEAEDRRITVQSQPGQIVSETLSRKNRSHKRAGGVPQDADPELKPQYHKKKKKKRLFSLIHSVLYLLLRKNYFN
jgi:hypothetical protein